MPVVTEFWPYGILRSGTTRAGYMTILAAHFTRAYRVLDDQVTPMSIAEVDALFDELHRPNKMAQLIYVKEKR